MEKLDWKNKLIIVTILAVLLTGCGVRERSEDRTMPDAGMSGEEETHIAEEKTEEEKTEEELQQVYAKLTPLDTMPESNENMLLFGNLQITLPSGVTVEQQEPDKDAAIIDLIGAENLEGREGYGESGPLPPRIWLTNYHAEYDNIMELISVLLDLLPDASLGERYASGKERYYLFTYDKLYKNGYILIYGEDVYLVEELSLESDYSFGQLLDNKAVRGENGIYDFGGRYGYADKTYSKINVQNDMSFLVSQNVIRDRMQVILLFEDGYFSSPYQNIAYEEWREEPVFEDCNFDGCPDMIVSETKIYLWNADKKEYEAAQIPEDFPEYSWKTKRYLQTQTVWTYDSEYVENADGERSWNNYDRTETLWKWEETALVKKRECVAKVREDGVQIWAYEDNPENVLFDETFTAEEWKQNSNAVQKRYQQFYAGMVPEENDGTLHEIDYNQAQREYIPQTLLDCITKSMLNGTELETLSELINDKELTKEEVLALATDNIALRNDVIEADRSGDYIMVMTDGDNDGIIDIVAEEYFGGTAGFTEYVFYQGQEDGSYQRTSSYDAVKEEFGMISYEGKNYLCRTCYDYGKKIYSGISLACYVDGIRVETADLMLFPEKYDIQLAECVHEEYRAFAEDVFEDSLHFKERIDAHENINGSREEQPSLEKEYRYQCDLDNDGEMEYYNKSIWEPSNMGTHESLNLYGEGTGIENVENAMQTVRGRPMMMWIEPFGEENVINVISLTGLHDFEITGFLLNGADYKTIYRIIAEVTYGVNCEVSSRMQ